MSPKKTKIFLSISANVIGHSTLKIWKIFGLIIQQMQQAISKLSNTEDDVAYIILWSP